MQYCTVWTNLKLAITFISRRLF